MVRRLKGFYETSNLALQKRNQGTGEKARELEALQLKFVAEAQRSAALADALEEANERVQRVEGEIAIVEAAKKANEERIQSHHELQ